MTLEAVRQAFAARVDGVNELIAFDDLVLKYLIETLGDVLDEVEDLTRYSQSTKLANRIAQLRNIREAQSLRPYYKTIYNQGVVLLVSYFDAAMGDLFCVAVADALRDGLDVPARKRNVDLNWASLAKPDAPLERLIADRIVEKDDISFQDMKSIARAFTDALNVTLDRDTVTNDIIIGQAARHVLVHAGGKIDERFHKQVSGAKPRRLKSALPHAGYIQFEPSEVMELAAAMQIFIDRTILAVRR